jgi:hypothetical protein
MHSPAAALAWEFWGRHRLGLCAVVALVAGSAVYAAAVPLTPTFGFVHTIWFVIALCYVIGVFAYGFDGKLESAESGFPARHFVLPVRTSVLVGWPMLQGMVAAVVLWLAWEYAVLRPAEIEVPPWWPFMLAALVAISQAVAWWPFGLPYVRILVAAGALTALVRAQPLLQFVAAQGVATEWLADPDHQGLVLRIVAVALIPVAFLAARAGVSRARHGESPDWLRAWRFARSTGKPRRDTKPFASARRAQMWYEWRTRGRAFVFTVALLLAALTALGALLESDNSRRTGFGVMLLLTPLIMTPIWGSIGGTAGRSVRSMQLTSFAATRPLGSAALVGAKFLAAGVAALAAVSVMFVAYAAWLAYTGGYHDLERVWNVVTARNGTARATALCVLIPFAMVLTTWRILVVNFWAGLTGREWVPVAQTILFCFLGLQAMREWVMWDVDKARTEQILGVLPWAAGAAVVLKFVVAAWAFAALRRRDMLGADAIVKYLAAWVLVAAALFGLLLWLVPREQVSVYSLAAGVALFVPLTRLAVAPLALAWNRHR